MGFTIKNVRRFLLALLPLPFVVSCSSAVCPFAFVSKLRMNFFFFLFFLNRKKVSVTFMHLSRTTWEVQIAII
jgi:hypothetical protein